MIHPAQPAGRTFESRISAMRFWCVLAAYVFVLSLCACTQTKPSQSSSAATVQAATESQSTNADAENVNAPRVNGDKAMRYTADVVHFGPRYIGSPGHKKTEDYLRAHLKADHLEEDAFTAATPAGNLPMRNFIAKFPGNRDGIIV